MTKITSINEKEQVLHGYQIGKGNSYNFHKGDKVGKRDTFATMVLVKYNPAPTISQNVVCKHLKLKFLTIW